MLITSSPSCGSRFCFDCGADASSHPVLPLRCRLLSCTPASGWLQYASLEPPHHETDRGVDLADEILCQANMCSVTVRSVSKPGSPRSHKIQKCLLALYRLQHRVRTSSSVEGSTKALDTSLRNIATNWEHVLSDHSGSGREETVTTCCSF